jgi:transcriptional regulator with XRE-family HTH domain
METDLPTAVLRAAREKAGLNQAALATKLKVSPSVVSRLEKTENTDAAMAHRYLAAVGTDECAEIRAYYELDWHVSDRPSFLHPDREVLGEIETALQRLEAFEASTDFDPILTRPLEDQRRRLLTTAQFLFRIDHGIAWIGDIGVGKTTALSRTTNLILTDVNGQSRSVFPTGSGRTTVCEVVVKVAPAHGISAKSLGDDRVRELVSDLVSGLQGGETGVSAEIERVLRNMADVRRRPVAGADGRRSYVDPIREMLATSSVEEVVNRILILMALGTRTQNQMILSEDKEKGVEWLSENIARINNGQHPGFSVPERITVLLPSRALRSSPFDLSVIDTKGIEVTTQRADLRLQLDEPRTLVVLCSKFADAPGATPSAIIRELHQGGSDAVERGRICLLVLPRDGEARNVRDDAGEMPETVEDGYAIRDYQIRQALATDGLPEIPVFFFDAARDDPKAVWSALGAQLQVLRQGYRDRARRLASAVVDLIANADAARSQEARSRISTVVAAAVDRSADLPISTRPAYMNLVEQLRLGHQSSICAAVNRRGDWVNFSVTHILGVGVRQDAFNRSKDPFVRLDEALAGLADEFAPLTDVVEQLGALRDELADWKQAFLSQALAVGRAAFRNEMDEAVELWRWCRQQWGAGSGYRERIAERVQDYFQTEPSLEPARLRVEAGVGQAWRELVLEKLAAATRVDLATQD